MSPLICHDDPFAFPTHGFGLMAAGFRRLRTGVLNRTGSSAI
jgi:hypothetical protein